MIKAINLSKYYGEHIALDKVNFQINKGEVLGFLGPNGAGKTTTMNIITGYLSTSQGEVKVNEMDVLEHPEEVKKLIGFLPETPPLYPELTVSEYLDFAARLKKISRTSRKQEISRVMEQVQLTDHRKRLCGNLSKGYRQRTGLAQALLGDPPILIMDEPTSGLDPAQIIEMRDLVRDLGKEHTVVLSSHILHEVQEVCSRLLIINKGKIVASGSPQQLSAKLARSGQLFARVAGKEEETRKSLKSLSAISRIEISPSLEENCLDLVIHIDEGKDLRKDIFFAFAKAGIPLLQFRAADPSIEDIFLHLTSNQSDNKGGAS